jgi:hypothetical protein
MPYVSKAQAGYFHTHKSQLAKQGVSVAEWDKASKGLKLPKRVVKKKKVKVIVDNKLGKRVMGEMQDGKNELRVNMKAHKKRGKLDKAELASTIKHEMMHIKHPKLTEKEVYKRTAKTKISPKEQQQLLKKIRHKKINYRIGVIKRKLKFKASDKVETGSLINRVNQLTKRDVAIRGLI